MSEIIEKEIKIELLLHRSSIFNENKIDIN